jgi:hypothetical protein
MLSSTVDLQGELSQASVECSIESPGAEQSDHGIMGLQEAERTNWGKSWFSHRGECGGAQANLHTTGNDELSEFYD